MKKHWNKLHKNAKIVVWLNRKIFPFFEKDHIEKEGPTQSIIYIRKNK